MAWFEYPSNFSNGTAVEGIGTFMQYASFTSSDVLGLAYTIIIWISLFGLSMLLGAKKAVASVSFITFIFGIYLFRAGLLNPIVLIVLIVLSIVGALGTASDKGL